MSESAHEKIARQLRQPSRTGPIRVRAAEAIEDLLRENALLKGAVFEALNNAQDRLDNDCKCRECTFTLAGVEDTLRRAVKHWA